MIPPLLITIAGVCHLGILLASFLTPKVLDWPRQLRPLHPLCRQVIWTHGAFIVLVIAGFGVISLYDAPDLASDTPLARALAGFIGLFWLARLFIQWFVFDARPFLTTRVLRYGYHGLTIVFIYLAMVYLVAALRPMIPLFPLPPVGIPLGESAL